MNHNELIEKLDANAVVIKGLFTNIPDEQIRWRPSPEKWSLIEVINHLYDEEREDFRRRLSLVLEDPEKPWPQITPADWVSERNYGGKILSESLESFMNERRDSIFWLKGLRSPNWNSAYQHPKLGPMSAEMILSNWLAHDYLHIRQIDGLHWAYLNSTSEGISLDYAGSW